jgi:hypothetical protein
MDMTRIAALPAQLRAAAHAITTLPDLTNLPRVHAITIGWDGFDGVLTLSAQMARTGDDERTIAALAAWAGALGSGLHLGEEVRNTAEYGYYWRKLSTTATLSDGTVIEVWDHLHYPVPATATEPPTPVPADTEPDTILAGAAR